MIELYLCYDCYWPICFPYGQKMHIGTGWYCWKQLQGGNNPPKHIKLTFNPDPQKLKSQYQEAIKIYAVAKSNGDMKQIIDYLKKQIRYNRGAVVQRFLEYLLRNKDRDLDIELRKLFRSKNWKNFIKRQIQKSEQSPRP